MNPSSLIVDASVAVKWFIEEVHCEDARRLLPPSAPLLAPDLLFPEVGSILWKRLKQGELALEVASAILSSLHGVGLQIVPSWPLTLSALEIAAHTGRTVYDSLYVALAVRDNGQLVTADAKLYNALHNGPLSPFLLWVEDIP